MKQSYFIITLLLIAVVSCNKVSKPQSVSVYRIQCSPKVKNVDNGIELIPGIDWEQKSSGDLTYSAITYYTKNGSSDLTRGFELQGGSTKSNNSSSVIVNASGIDELLVLVTVYGKDRTVLSREWYTSKSNG